MGCCQSRKIKVSNHPLYCYQMCSAALVVWVDATNADVVYCYMQATVGTEESTKGLSLKSNCTVV